MCLVTPMPARAELPSLQRIIDLARARAIVVHDARAELGVAEATLAGARVSFLGNPYSDIQIDRGIGNAESLQALTYTYFPVDLAGQRGRRMEEADRLIDWKGSGVEEARAMAAGDAVAAYGELLVGLSRAAEASLGERAARDEAAYFNGRLLAKDATAYEEALARAEITRWVQTGAEAQLRITRAHARLAELTGELPLELPSAAPAPSPPPLRSTWDDGHIASVLERAPIIVRLRAEERYWDASAGRYDRERVPPLSLEIIAGRGALGEARVGGGAVVTFPVTRRYQGEIEHAERAREQAAQGAELYRSVLRARLRAARDVLQTVRRTLEDVDENGVPALEQSVIASEEAFKAGKVDLTRTLLVRRDLAAAKARRLDILEAGWRAYADLVILSGELP
jgi:cobalt-zinc-cadmium efflux system outer membrane protein